MPLREWGLGLEQVTEYYHKYGLYFTDKGMNNPTSQVWFIDRGIIDQGRRSFKFKGKKKFFGLWSPLEIDLVGLRLNIANGDLEEIRLIQCKEKVTPKEANQIIHSFTYFPRLQGIMTGKSKMLTKYVAYVDITPKAEKLLMENKISLLSFREMITKLLLLTDVLIELRRKGFMREPAVWMLRALKDNKFITKGKESIA